MQEGERVQSCGSLDNIHREEFSICRLCMYPGGARGQTTTPLGLLIGHGGDAPDGIVTHQVLEYL